MSVGRNGTEAGMVKTRGIAMPKLYQSTVRRSPVNSIHKRIGENASVPRDCRMSGKTRLRGEADRRICGAESRISAPLHNFEEKSALEIPSIRLEIFAVTLPVVEHVVRAQALERERGQVDAGFKIVVVVLRDRQQIHSARLQPLDCRKDVVRRKRDMLDAGAKQIAEKS